MMTWRFSLRLNRPVEGDEFDLLYEAGLSDASIVIGPPGSFIWVTRESPSRQEAIDSAIREVATVPGLAVVSVEEL